MYFCCFELNTFLRVVYVLYVGSRSLMPIYGLYIYLLTHTHPHLSHFFQIRISHFIVITEHILIALIITVQSVTLRFGTLSLSLFLELLLL